MFGLGTVARTVLDYLDKIYDEEKTGVKINLKRVVVRDVEKPRPLSVNHRIISDDPGDILKNDDINIVVELVGGYEQAKHFILESLENGKDVVTANKAVLAKYGREIFGKAREKGRNVAFQASVGGEMRIIETLSSIPSFRDVKAILGILNGTSNYILTMMMDGETYEDALKSAEEKGFAEPDPRFDVEGTDATQKLSLLTSIVFGVYVDFEHIHREGISDITKSDIKSARTFGYTIKPLAIAKRRDNGLELRVHPTLIPRNHPLASVSGENNALSIYFEGRNEPITIIGKGAGKYVARSVIADIVEIAKKRRKGLIDLPQINFDRTKIRTIEPESFETPYCFRFSVDDKPGTLGSIAVILGNHGINISGVRQVPEDKIGDVMPLAVKVDTVRNGSVYEALEEIKRLPTVKEMLSIRIYE